MGVVNPAQSETIAAIATGGALSAIGILRVSGPDAVTLMDRVFRPTDGKSMSAHADRQLVYGELLDKDDQLLDICLCTVSRAPRSYTGEDTAELQCHGSPVVLRQGLESLFARGARQALAGEFTRRAFLNGRMDLTQAEAVIDLIDAETPAAARNAAGQLTGAVYRRAEKVYAALTDICSHYHAVLDYPDEEIPPFAMRSYAAVLRTAAEDLQALLDTFHRGYLLEKGIKTAIVGKPNAGKSSLLNALLGYERAIVTDIPGTTRDTLSERCMLGDIPLRLTDTAGLRTAADTVERLGVERAREAMEDAELVLWVFDVTRPWKEEADELPRLGEHPGVHIAVLNKSDLPALWGEEKLPEGFDAVCCISAKEHTGLDALEKTVGEAFPLPEAAVGEILTNARQAEAISRALDFLRAAEKAMAAGITPDAVLTECEGAMDAIAELTGRRVREDVTQKIFSRFCVGK